VAASTRAGQLGVSLIGNEGERLPRIGCYSGNVTGSAAMTLHIPSASMLVTSWSVLAPMVETLSGRSYKL
jgi:hypothetical protein